MTIVKIVKILYNQKRKNNSNSNKMLLMNNKKKLIMKIIKNKNNKINKQKVSNEISKKVSQKK